MERFCSEFYRRTPDEFVGRAAAPEFSSGFPHFRDLLRVERGDREEHARAEEAHFHLHHQRF